MYWAYEWTKVQYKLPFSQIEYPPKSFQVGKLASLSFIHIELLLTDIKSFSGEFLHLTKFLINSTAMTQNIWSFFAGDSNSPEIYHAVSFIPCLTTRKFYIFPKFPFILRKNLWDKLPPWKANQVVCEFFIDPKPSCWHFNFWRWRFVDAKLPDISGRFFE